MQFKVLLVAKRIPFSFVAQFHQAMDAVQVVHSWYRGFRDRLKRRPTKLDPDPTSAAKTLATNTTYKHLQSDIASSSSAETGKGQLHNESLPNSSDRENQQSPNAPAPTSPSIAPVIETPGHEASTERAETANSKNAPPEPSKSVGSTNALPEPSKSETDGQSAPHNTDPAPPVQESATSNVLEDDAGEEDDTYQLEDDILQDYQPCDWAPHRPLDSNRVTFHDDVLDRNPALKTNKWGGFTSDVRSQLSRLRLEYKYTRLKRDEIRLLYVYPGQKTDQMKCQILRRRLDNPSISGRFNALSYHWGPDDPDNEIWLTEENPSMSELEQELVNMRNSGKVSIAELHQASKKAAEHALSPKWFKVRENLWNCLHALRSPSRPLLLWIDAICIDQETEDNEEAAREKDIQIAMMAQIYSSAFSVCVWLGNSDQKSSRGMKFIRELVKIPHLDTFVHTEFEKHREDWKALRDGILQYRWFSRRWVVQEISLAIKASVHIGHEVCELFLPSKTYTNMSLLRS
jgi:hypothetical protein